MNFMPATLEGDTVKLPFGDVRLPDELRGAVGDGGSRDVIAGIRPETFEDASLVGDLRDRGHVLKAKIDLVESMGSEQYAYFEIESEGVESEELAELAADSGAAEVPGSGTGQVVARLDAREPGPARRGGRALARHDSKLHLFDPELGSSGLGAEQPAQLSRSRRQAVDEGVLVARRVLRSSSRSRSSTSSSQAWVRRSR